VIREARQDDIGNLLRLIRALAAYEREPDAVETTETMLEAALFGPTPSAHAHVVEEEGRVVGMALWFLSFSTWTGRPSLYLEDLFVEPDQRRKGIGGALMNALFSKARELDCGRMEWAVLDWNEPALRFYRSLGARPLDEWTTWRLELPSGS
jgi:GNAT superfamily N-acetyltransferase